MQSWLYLGLGLWITVGCGPTASNSRSPSAIPIDQPESSESLATSTGSAPSHLGQQGWEVVSTKPQTVIKHGVDLKGFFDEERAPVSLSGPELVSQSVSLNDSVSLGAMAYLNWYRITKGAPESHGSISLRDSLFGNESYQVNVGSPAYLLSPAQRLTDGPPAEVPPGLNHFKVYALDDAPELNKMVQFTGSLAGSGRQRQVISAAFVCLPAEEWHHEEHFEIADLDSCYVVYRLGPEEVDVSLTTMDQFGIHQLTAQASTWLCVPATMNR